MITSVLCNLMFNCPNIVSFCTIFVRGSSAENYSPYSIPASMVRTARSLYSNTWHLNNPSSIAQAI
jgi:hypothetical protein